LETETQESTQPAKPSTRGAIRQSVCSVCGKRAGPGSAIVVHFGAGGRIHIACKMASAEPTAGCGALQVSGTSHRVTAAIGASMGADVGR
jgi:hypothetical protein